MNEQSMYEVCLVGVFVPGFKKIEMTRSGGDGAFSRRLEAEDVSGATAQPLPYRKHF